MADNTFLVKLGMNVQELVNGVNKANSVMSGFKSTMAKVGLGLSAIQIGHFVLDVSRLAGEAEGVRAAFNKLGDSAKLMVDLKNAIGGTVSELELMKRSVMASNFDISLKALPQLLEFATIRARQTGQSVDYLVDSIVTGIGRKSKLILDNLGISAVQLTEALGGASAASSSIGEVAEAVGRIAEKNLKQMGKLTDDAAVKADRLAASWANVKVSMGNIVNNSGLPDFFEKLAKGMNSIGLVMDQGWGVITTLEALKVRINDLNRSNNGIGAFGPDATKELNRIREAAKRLGVDIRILQESSTGATKVFMVQPKGIWLNGSETEKQIRNIKFLQETIKGLEEEISLTTNKEFISNWQEEIKSLQKEIDVLLGKIQKLPKLDFSGLRGSALPELPKNKSLFGNDEFFQGKSDKMFKDFENNAKALRNQTELLKEARQAVDDYSFATTKGIARAQAAYADFVKSGDSEAFNNQLQAIKESEQAMFTMASKFGNEMGEAFGDVITGAKSLGEAMAAMASSVIDSLERVVLANMIANSSKYGLPGILLAGAGFGVVKSIFKNIGKGTGSKTYGDVNRSSYGSYGQAPGFSLRVAGTDLIAVMDNTNRSNGRTRGFNVAA